MAEPNITDIESTGVNTILTVNHRNLRGEFKIPIYQRPYTWSKDNVSQLFEDFVEHSESDSQMAYYLGQFVFVKLENEQSISILDGQQRITTLYIFVIALKNYLGYLCKKIKSNDELEFDEKEEFIKEINGTGNRKGMVYYLNNLIFKDPDAENPEGRLLMAYPDDNEHFKFLLRNNSIIDIDDKIRNLRGEIKKNHKIIIAAKTLYENMIAYIDNRVKANSTVSNYFSQHLSEYGKIEKYLKTDKTEVTYTLLKPGLEFTIFETLNNRGQNLNAYDLTRNILLNISGKLHINKKSETQSAFDKRIRVNCRKNGRFNSGFADKLILSCWNMSNEGKITSGKYMKSFTTFVKNDITEGNFSRNSPGASDRFDKYLTKLKDCSVFFSELEDPNKLQNRLNSNSSNTKKLIDRMKLFKLTNFKQHYPVYFALGYKDFPENLILKVFKLIESTDVNFILLGKRSPSLIESLFSNIAYKIYKSESIDDSVYNQIKGDILRLAEEKNVELHKFKELFSELNVTNNNTSHYLLRNISIFQQSASELDFCSDDLTLEHVMPEQWEEYWNTENIFLKRFNDEGKEIKYKLDNSIHSEFINRLGNHTLLKLPENAENNNREYDFKLNVYGEQLLKITNDDEKEYSVNNYSTWNADSIRERQKALSELSYNIWKIEE